MYNESKRITFIHTEKEEDGMASDDMIRITWLGHACFKVESQGYAVVIDPYEDGYVPGLAPLRDTANHVLCSHKHGDHNYKAAISVSGRASSPFRITALPTYHDDKLGELRGSNTIHILENGFLRVAHLGDLGCGLTEEQAVLLTGLDAVMIPVGGYYTIDARQAKALVDRIQPKVVIPMHYRGETFGFDVLATIDDFTDLCEVVVEYPGCFLELTKDTEPHTAILKL